MCDDSCVFRTFTNEKCGSVRAAKIGGNVLFVEDDVRNCLEVDKIFELKDGERTVINGCRLVLTQGLNILAICSKIDTTDILEFHRWIDNDVIPSLEQAMDVTECLKQLQRQVLDLKKYVDECVGKDAGIDLAFEIHRFRYEMYDMDVRLDELCYGDVGDLRKRVEILESKKVKPSRVKDVGLPKEETVGVIPDAPEFLIYPDAPEFLIY